MAQTSRMQPAMRMRSRRGSSATVDGLRTAPAEWCVLSVVPAARIVQGQAKRVDVTLQGAGEREAVSRGMASVVQLEWGRRVRVHPHGSLRSHVDQLRRGHRPAGAVALEADRRRFHATKLSDTL